MELCQTGTFLWNSNETDKFLSERYDSNFYFNGFQCSLCSKPCTSSYQSRSYTVFYITSTTFPEGFSRFYTFSLIDYKGNECCTSKGSIRNEKSQVLLCVFDQQLPPQEKTIRISWSDNESYINKFDKDIQVDPEESALLLETLSKDFEHLYEGKVDTDCLLKVGEQQFPVHRQVLVARSTVFEAMFRHDTLESRCGTVDIPDIEADVMSDVLFYIYTGKIRNLTSASAVSIYVAADKYALIELRDKCIDCLLNCMTRENFSDAAVLAHTHGETKLEDKVVFFIEERLEELMDDENWKSFLKNKSVLASKLLCSALMANKVKMKMSSQ